MADSRDPSFPQRLAPEPLLSDKKRPSWGQLARRGGDRISVLFAELRTRLADIPGLIEELQFDNDSGEWEPRYRVGDRTLFRLQISPGRLDATAEFSAAEVIRLLASPRLSARIRQWLQSVSSDNEGVQLRARISTDGDASSFAALAVKLSRLMTEG